MVELEVNMVKLEAQLKRRGWRKMGWRQRRRKWKRKKRA